MRTFNLYLLWNGAGAKTLLCLLAASVMFCIPASGNHAPGNQSTSDSTPYAVVNTCVDSMVITKRIIDKSHKIFLYPDASQTVLFFNVRGMQGKVYQLFVFDLDGNVIEQREIRNRQTTLIEDLQKGIYIFEVFSDDEKIGNGQIDVI